jgi:prophage DNA circulation protein
MSGLIGGIGRAAAVVNQVGAVARSVGTLAGDVGNLIANGPFGLGGSYGAIGAGLGPWADGLLPASFRGIPFAVRTAPIKRGRKVAVHEYPFRDDVWVEDLGRGTRVISFTGFILGDDVYAQRDAHVMAAETAGQGTLVHPSLGSVQASLVEFSATERFELGRVVELEFSFIQSAQKQPQYPTTATSTQAAATTAATDADAASATGFAGVVSSVQTGVSAVQAGVRTAEAFGATAIRLVGDASRVVGAVKGLAGVVGGGSYYGRYNAGSLTVAPTLATPVSSALGLVARTEAATTGLLSASLAATTAVSRAAGSLGSLAAAL